MKYLFGLLILTVNLFAIPRFAALEGLDCATCHVSPAGGGARNPYGSEYMNESLTALKAVPDLSRLKAAGIIPEGLLVGADLRYQAVATETVKHFPMQASVYLGWEFSNIQIALQSLYVNDEPALGYTLRWEGLPLESWLSVARQVPAFGLRTDDHTAFIRGGNLTRQALDWEGMPFIPTGAVPHGISLGSGALGTVILQVGLGEPFLQPASDASAHGYLRLDTWGYQLGIDYQVSVSQLNEGDLSLSEIDILAGRDAFSYQGAFSRAMHWTGPDLLSLAVLHEWSYRPLPGMDLFLRYEFWDPDISLQDGAIDRWALGVDLFPVNGIEFKLLYRIHGVDNADFLRADQDRQLLAQVHVYY